MKKIKQIVFDITSSRRIRNFLEQKKMEEKVLLDQMREAIHIIYTAWQKNYSDSELSFNEYFQTVLKYAEFLSRLEQRKKELEKIQTHVEILEEAIEEYEEDYNYIRRIEKIVEAYESGKK